MELPMAGHPTVGTAYVLARLGHVASPGALTFQEGVGPIPVSLTGTGDAVVATMTQPIPTFGAVREDRAAIAELVSLSEADLLPDVPVQFVSAGVPFLYIPLRSLDAVRRATLRLDLWQANFADDIPQMFLFTLETEDPAATVHARMFAPVMGIPEDPATGAACGPLGAYLWRYQLAAPGDLRSEQGYEMGRPSQINIRVEANGDTLTRVQVGGRCVYMGHGFMELK
jgi:trans-2,3-dihydro-3-hydroxyanthranilate isomerase